jgi:hypothetical protein
MCGIKNNRAKHPGGYRPSAFAMKIGSVPAQERDRKTPENGHSLEIFIVDSPKGKR